MSLSCTFKRGRRGRGPGGRQRRSFSVAQALSPPGEHCSAAARRDTTTLAGVRGGPRPSPRDPP
eukprot:410240-Pyramimonas_sp.AAC.1